jgi:dihydropteroate synthase
MKVRIVSIKSEDILKGITELTLTKNHNLYFPTFGLLIEEIQDESFKSEFEKLESTLPTFIESRREMRRVLILGDLNSFQNLSNKFAYFQQTDLSRMVKDSLELYNNSQNYSYSFGRKNFSGSNCYVMGILNLTTNSFYDGGTYFGVDAALKRAFEILSEGADIIDIGAESTRPGADPISDKEELKKILPVVRKLQKENITISIDTYKSKVAEACLEEGAHIINDISGLKFDKGLAKVIAKYNAGLVLMHIRGTPKTMQLSPTYVNAVDEIFDELKVQILQARKEGISKIYVDPGIGFGKRLKDNYEILNRLDEFRFLGYPIAIGLSRKSFIGSILNQNPDERLIGTIAADASAQLSGANIIRVHDVKEMIQVKKIINLIKKPNTN